MSTESLDAIVGAARRALVLGVGGGGDVVGALAAARRCEQLGTPFVVGGVAWERLPIDPRPGPRPLAEIRGARALGEFAALADAQTTTSEGVRFSESHVAAHLGAETVLIDVSGGAAGAAAGIETALGELECDLLVCVDVGGDVLATGAEPGLASPLCDAVMMAGALAADQRARPLMVVAGIGCDGELSHAHVLARIAACARHGAWIGCWSVGAAIASELEAAAAGSGTEASLQIARCARGELGETPIRGGRRTVWLDPVGAILFAFDPAAAPGEVAPLAGAVKGSRSIADARDALAAHGIRTELDYELERAAERA